MNITYQVMIKEVLVFLLTFYECVLVIDASIEESSFILKTLNASVCNADAVWKNCSYSGAECADNCRNYELNSQYRFCRSVCEPGCDPAPGYVFEKGQSGLMIPTTKCPSKCVSNMKWTKCSFSVAECADNCENYILNSKYRFCKPVCKPGCDPSEEYVFLSGQAGDVIKAKDCPKTPECGKNAYWNQICSYSSRGCARNCSNPYPDFSQCSNECKPACDPKDGFVFINDSSGDAVLIERCPYCKDNFDWKSNCSHSAANCADNCDNHILNSKFRFCNAVCKPGCDPTKGYVFAVGQSGDVLKAEDCPKAPKCGKNAHWNYACSYSGRGCAKNCSNPYPDLSLCNKDCKPGCDPNDGFVFINNSSSDAVPVKRCPYCRDNFDWNSNCSYSAANCADNCDNYIRNSKFRFCNAVCEPGCDPAPGFVFEEGQSGKVIPIGECNKPRECEKNAYLNYFCSYFERGCARTCLNPYPGLSLCTQECKPGCDPKKGYVFKDENDPKSIAIFERNCPRCPPNFIWNKCSYTVADCVDNCDNFVRNSRYRHCKAVCKPGCDPAPGFVFEKGQSGEVIAIENCHKPRECARNGYWNHFCSYSGRGCAKNCLIQNPDYSVCTKECKSGCDPKDGFVFLEYQSGDAITLDKCPKCPLYSHFNRKCSRSAADCADNCENYVRNSKYRICKAACKEGCDPNEGFAFENGQSGKVIPIIECPALYCGPFTRWNRFCSASGRKCARNCIEQKNTENLCTQDCVSGCDPVDGFLFLIGQSDEAVPPNECPPNPATMPAFEHFIYGVDITKYDYCPKKGEFKDLPQFRGVKTPIFNFSYRIQQKVKINRTIYIIPDQVEPFDFSAQMGMFAYSIDTIDSIQKLEESMTANVTVESDFFIGKAEVGASYQELKTSIKKENKQIVQSSRYIRSYEVNLVDSNELKNCLSNDFIRNVEKLTGTYETNSKLYEKFIQEFGTHYYERITFGGTHKFRASVTFFASHTIETSIIAAWAKIQVFSYSDETSSEEKHEKEFKTLTNTSDIAQFSCGGGLPFNKDKNIDWKDNNIDDIHHNPWPIYGYLISISNLISDYATKKELQKAIFAKQAEKYIKSIVNDLNQTIPRELALKGQIGFFCSYTIIIVITDSSDSPPDSCCDKGMICCFNSVNQISFDKKYIQNFWTNVDKFSQLLKGKNFNLKNMEKNIKEIENAFRLLRKQTCLVI